MIAQASITSQVVEDIRVRDELAATEGLELNENPRFRTLSCTDSVGAESVTNRSVAAQGVDNIGVSHRRVRPGATIQKTEVQVTGKRTSPVATIDVRPDRILAGYCIPSRVRYC